MKQVYLDNAATTPLREEVILKMTSVMREFFGNASSTHRYGRSSKVLIETIRKYIASTLGVTASEIVFTSGGTEANNQVLLYAVRDLQVKHIITSRIEHHAVLHTVEALAGQYDVKVDYIDLDRTGHVDYSHLEELLKGKAGKALVSLMHINNETGHILDLKRVGLLCRNYEALFHSDMVQSVGHFKLDLNEIPVDFIVASAHKFHGPKGIGFTFFRKEAGLKSLILGGEQERGLRAGTESVHNIVGLGEALKLAYENLETEAQYIGELKSYFTKHLQEEIPEVKFNGNSDSLNSNTYTLVNVCLPFPAEKASILLFQLDLKGVACSRGSACQSGSQKGSHVLEAILNEEDLKKASLRFSFSRFNTKEEIDYAISAIKSCIS
ncbi:cysteine desulfurase family protein [Formosa sp. S-31]|uniref:cysteine desulfurase family protein n=1 Tax=Formosa sp. S-31 TaxID=2790949 RepID=UPI003EB727D4